MGELQLSYHDFHCMSFRNYSRLANGYWKRHSRYLEGCRLTAYTILSVNRQKGKTLPPADKIWPLITDDRPIIPESVPKTKEEIAAIAQRYFPNGSK